MAIEANAPPVTELPDKGPVSDVALSQKDGATDIAEMLGDDLDLSPDPVSSDEEGPADDPITSDEDDVDVSEDVETENDEPTDAPYADGRFAADTAKVKLANGQTISVAELKQHVDKRVADFQRDYTQKAEELSVRRKEVDQVSEQTRKEREFLIWFAEKNVPQPPTPPTEPATVAPLAHLQYAEDMRAYEAMANAWHTMKQAQAADQERTQTETVQQTRERLAAEAAKLKALYPDLNDRTKAEKFWTATVTEAESNYGFTSEEIFSLTDHRMIKALRDANAYQRAKKKVPAVQQEVARRPPMVQGGGKRSDPKTTASRAKQASSDRLRQSGSMRDGIDAIAHLID